MRKDTSSITEYVSFTTKTAKEIKFYLGDCFVGMETVVSPESVDLVVTSPPYNLGTNYTNYDDQIPRESYLKWMKQWAERVEKVLKPSGSLFLNLGSKPSDPWVPFDVASQLRDIFVMQNVIHWIKSITVESGSYNNSVLVSAGHFKPINSKRFLNDTHEYIFHFTKNGNVELDRLSVGTTYKDNNNTKRWKSGTKGVRCRGNSWFIPYPTIQSKKTDRPHPASFPPKLAEMCIKLHGLDRVELVVDPFLGIGNTAIACAGLGVGMIGFDIDEDYLKTASETLKKITL
jgi:site-specific DNA-methyltransferase (adenine-specific)